MTRSTRLLSATACLLVACGPSGDGDDAYVEESAEAGEAELAAPDGAEESAEQLAKDETYDHEHAGSRLMLAYDEQANAFTGTVENVGAEPLTSVRVEVHLSNGVELGPTTPGDLAPGESREVVLEASDDAFETWSAHAEFGGAEGEHDGEDDEHEGRESGESGNEEESGEGKKQGEHEGKD